MVWLMIGLRWGGLLLGVGLIWLALSGLDGLGRAIAGLPGLVLVGLLGSGACTPATLSVGDDHGWTIYSELGLPVATIPPDEPRALRNQASAQTLHRDATRRLSTHTGEPAVDTIEIKQQWLEVRTARGVWVVPDLQMHGIGYAQTETLGLLHHYGEMPSHTVVGGQVAFPTVPDHPILHRLKVGQAVRAHDKGQWWPAHVLAVDPAQGVKVHYDTFGAEWDAWLWPHRVDDQPAPPGSGG